MLIAGAIRIVERVYPPGLRMARHEHEAPSMSLVVSGTLLERMGRSEESARPLSISVLPPGMAHDDEFGRGGARLLQVHFEVSAARDLMVERGTFERWRWTHAGPAVQVFVRLLAAIRAGARAQAIEQLVIDAIAASSSPQEVDPKGQPPRWLRAVRAAIDDSTEWPTVHGLADVGGVHRVHLARQFRRYYGCTVTEYVRRRALQRATLLMAQPNTPIAAAANAAGFTDQSHLCRTFRTETAVAPSTFRSLARDSV